MAKDEIDDLDKKKQELEEQLHQIQDELDESFDKVRSDVSSTLNPKKIIQRYPLSVMGSSVLLGFLFGLKGKGNSTSTDNSSTSTSTSTSTTREFGSALFSALKRLATRKAITFATDYIEGIIEEKAEKHLSSENGEKED